MLQWEPDNSRALGNLGLNRLMEGQLEEARELLERAAALDPSALRVRLNLAQLYSQRQNLARARKMAREAYAIDPNHPRARQLIRNLG